MAEKQRTIDDIMNRPANVFEEIAGRALRAKERQRPGQRVLFDNRGRPAAPGAEEPPREDRRLKFPPDEPERDPAPNSPEDVGYRAQTVETERRDRAIYGQSFTRVVEGQPPERIDPSQVVLEEGPDSAHAQVVAGEMEAGARRMLGMVEEARGLDPEPASPASPPELGVDPAVPGTDQTVTVEFGLVDGVPVQVTPQAELPENNGTTGWQYLARPDGPLLGLDAPAHGVLDLVRWAPKGKGREPVSRLWTIEGVIAGLTSGNRCPRAPAKGLLLADDAGLALLRGKLPEPVRPPLEGSYLHGRVKVSPWSDIRWIAVAVGLEELCLATLWANRLATIEKMGAVPVLGLMPGDFEGLIKVKRPKGSGLLANNKGLREWIDEEMWGTKIEAGGW